MQKQLADPSPQQEKTMKRSLFGLPSTVEQQEVPLLFQEPNVHTGFRRLHQPWYYYPLSVFQLHNESMNVWTHLLACILHLAQMYRISQHVDFIGDPHTWPLLAGLLCSLALYGCSAAAHCMQSHSEIVHYTSFMCDYSGIGLYGLGSIIVHLAYCSEDSFFYLVHRWFVPAGCTLGFAIAFCCTIAKVIYRRPYPFSKKIWQITPVCGIYVLIISPILHRLAACLFYATDCNDSIPFHIKQMAWFLVSGICFASDIPQRLFPGKCDYFFHSHQLFHIAIMTCTLYQMEGVFIDLLTRQEMLMSRPEPTFGSAFGPVITVVTLEIVNIITFYLLIKLKLTTGKGKWLDGVGMGHGPSGCDLKPDTNGVCQSNSHKKTM